jgi:hypothetical protein
LLRTLPAGLLAKFRAEKDKINKANSGYYMIPKRQKIGGQNAKSKNTFGLRIAARAAKAKEDGKELLCGFWSWMKHRRIRYVYHNNPQQR